jgi:hypothetical protein
MSYRGLRHHSDTYIGCGKHAYVLDAAEMNSIVDLPAESGGALAQVSLQRSIRQADKGLVDNIGYGGARLGSRLAPRLIRWGTLLLTGGITVVFFVRAYFG